MDVRAVLSVVFAVCAGCGGGGGSSQTMDGPTTVPDAPAPDALPPNAVKLTVTVGGTPVAGRTVFFQQADSSMVATLSTDDHGVAGALVAAGGFVTVIDPEMGTMAQRAKAQDTPITIQSHLTTFVNVHPSDDLHLDLAPLQVTPLMMTFTLKFPDPHLDPSLNATFKLFAPCIDTKPITLTTSATNDGNLTAQAMIGGCDATTDLMVVAQDVHENSLVWLYGPDTAIAAGTTVTLPGPFQQPASVTLALSNVPSTNLFVGILRRLRSARGQVFFSGEAAKNPSAGTVSLSVPAPNPAGLQRITFVDGSNTTFNTQSLFVWAPDDDLSAIGTDYQAAMLRTLAIVAPYASAATHIAYPILPTAAYDYNATAGDSPKVDQLLTASITGPTPYQTLLAKVFLASKDAAPALLANVSGNGHLQINEYTPSP
jgi:hypothetical protein